jgi:hypothetical protein
MATREHTATPMNLRTPASPHLTPASTPQGPISGASKSLEQSHGQVDASDDVEESVGLTREEAEELRSELRAAHAQV